MICPVMYEAWGLHKKVTKEATSETDPNRLSGTDLRTNCFAFGGRSLVMSVSINPGATALTRIPNGPSSLARVSVRALIPPLAAL